MDDVSRFISSQLTSALYRYDPVSDKFEPALATRDLDLEVLQQIEFDACAWVNALTDSPLA